MWEGQRGTRHCAMLYLYRHSHTQVDFPPTPAHCCLARRPLLPSGGCGRVVVAAALVELCMQESEGQGNPMGRLSAISFFAFRKREESEVVEGWLIVFVFLNQSEVPHCFRIPVMDGAQTRVVAQSAAPCDEGATRALFLGSCGVSLPPCRCKGQAAFCLRCSSLLCGSRPFPLVPQRLPFPSPSSLLPPE